MSPTGGKTKTLPCGHLGECVLGDFYVCKVKGCDGEEKKASDLTYAKAAEDWSSGWSAYLTGFGSEDTDPGDEDAGETLRDILDCPGCASADTEPFAGSPLGPNAWHCLSCGKVYVP